MKIKNKRASRRQKDEAERSEKINKLENNIKETFHKKYPGLDLSRVF